MLRETFAHNMHLMWKLQDCILEQFRQGNLSGEDAGKLIEHLHDALIDIGIPNRYNWPGQPLADVIDEGLYPLSATWELS